MSIATTASAPDGVIFDLDGTLVDNMSFHVQAWSELGKKHGVPVSAERFTREFAGRKNEEIFPELLGRTLSPDELERLAEEKEASYRTLYGPHLALIAGAAALIARLAQRGCRLAIASAAPAKNRVFVLDGLGIRGHFQAVIGAEDARRGKPAPDLFLAAARGLSLPPERCAVFEDAPPGIQAALAAGMPAIGITTTVPAELLREAGARWTSPDLARLPADALAFLGLR